MPAVTVLIPAHNEETVIVQTVKSVLVSDLKDLRVIVVNDGSIDRTGDCSTEILDAIPRPHHSSVNRGKAARASAAPSANGHLNRSRPSTPTPKSSPTLHHSTLRLLRLTPTKKDFRRRKPPRSHISRATAPAGSAALASSVR